MECQTKFCIESKDFKEGEFLEEKYTPQGDDFSPQLSWKNIPQNTQSFALACEDPDAPMGTFYHWLVINIPVTTTSVEKNTVPGKPIENSWGITTYKGPSPPEKSIHRYFFKIFALDTDKINAIGIDSFYKEVNKHKLGEASIMVKYSKTHH